MNIGMAVVWNRISEEQAKVAELDLLVPEHADRQTVDTCDHTRL